MKFIHIHWGAVLAASLLAPTLAVAQDLTTNRLTFSGRFGFNVSAKFSGTAPIQVPPSSRTTPNGQPYNYDNGYVYPDKSGSLDGLTWYWGYDSGAQVNAANNTIQFQRSAGITQLDAPSKSDDFAQGAEFAFARQLGTTGDFRYGMEVAANYMNIDIGARGAYALRGSGVTDAYSYTPGTTPPGAPYQGNFDGPAYTIGANPVSSTPTSTTVGSVTGSRHLTANLWGGRLGPYIECDPSPGWTITLSGGLAVGWLDASASWNETATFNSGGTPLHDQGSGNDSDWQWGGYVGVTSYWRMNPHWSFETGFQFQTLGTYDHSFGSRRVELDLSKTFIFTLGLSYNF